MKRSIKHLTIEMALILATFANQSLAQSTPQQVAGTVNGKDWQALTDNAPAVAVSSTTKYVAWKSDTNVSTSCNRGRVVGLSSIWSGKENAYEQYLYRRGVRSFSLLGSSIQA
jgi:hypothetical protein